MLRDLLLNQTNIEQFEAIVAHPPSSLLLLGDRGSGKRALASALAADCLGISSPEHHSILVIDGSSEGIDEVRSVQKSLTLSVPGNKQSLRRVVIISNIDQLSREAVNALLKTIEEPPLDTLIIATAHSKASVLPTILSRMQTFHILPVSSENLEIYAKTHGFTGDVRRVFHLSGGLPGLAAELLSGNIDQPLAEAITEAKEFLGRTKAQRIALIDSLTKRSETDLLIFLEAIMKLLRAQLVMSSKNEPLTQRRLTALLQTMSDLQTGMNKKLALTRLFIEL